jgi:hypothetical protein
LNVAHDGLARWMSNRQVYTAKRSVPVAAGAKTLAGDASKSVRGTHLQQR